MTEQPPRVPPRAGIDVLIGIGFGLATYGWFVPFVDEVIVGIGAALFAYGIARRIPK